MTFEHAETTLQKLSDEGIGNFCQAACLDGILKYANIGEAHYRNFSLAVNNGDHELFIQELESMASTIFPEGTFQVGEREYHACSYEIEPGNPFTNEPEDTWSTPRPEHKKLFSGISVKEEDNAKYENEEDRLWTRRARENWMGLYVVLDNMFRDGLTIMIEQEQDDGRFHVCGLQQTGPDEFYLVNTDILEDGSPVIGKYGPSTLLEMCGFDDPNRPAEWHKGEEYDHANYFWVKAEDGTQRYSLQIFSPEPRP